jgi:hypothetical protein
MEQVREGEVMEEAARFLIEDRLKLQGKLSET